MTIMETLTHNDSFFESRDHVSHSSNDGDIFTSKLPWEADIAAGIYLLVIGVLSSLGNGYVLYTAITRKKKLRPAEIMTINLAVCDLGISVAGKPFCVVSFLSHGWIFGWTICKAYGWVGFFFGCGSLITLTVVSLDRYLKICHLRYGTWLKRRHAFISLLFIWSYASLWATLPLVGVGDYAPEPFGASCTLNWALAQQSLNGKIFVIAILFFCLLLPTAVIVFSYAKIIGKVKSSAKEIAHFDTRNQKNHTLEIKLTKVAMLICSGFLIAWIPYAVVSVISAFGNPDTVPIPASVIPTLLAKSSAMYNPIIYQVIDYKRPCCRKDNSLQKSNSRSGIFIQSGNSTL
uniref:Opsin-5 n=1 Tax=Leptobrachium leishanense TaxID=445787 RepID=A0A8C5PDG5_9ANUR